MPVNRRSRAVAFAALVLACYASRPAFAQERDTLLTEITGDGNVVLFDWDKKHPWDAELRTTGAALVAEYRTAQRGLVSEVLGHATPRAGNDRTIRFRLKDSITAPAVGPVCLFVQLGDQRLVPIRRANRRGDDTTRFRYEAWELEANKRSQAEAVRQRLGTAERDLAAATTALTAQQGVVAKNGWKGKESCEAIAAPQLGATRRPFDALDPPAQEDAARRVCVSRVWWGEDELTDRMADAKSKKGDVRAANSYLSLATRIARAPAVIDEQLKILRDQVGAADTNLSNRLKEAEQFRRDWDRWSSMAANYKEPHFGEFGDMLQLQTAAGDAALRVLGPSIARTFDLSLKEEAAATTVDRAGYVGGSLEAYARCVDDGKKQLKTKYESWQDLQARAPQLNARAREDLVRACQREFTTLDQLTSARSALAEQLQRDQQTLAAASVPAALSGKPQTLNMLACAP